MLNSRRGLTFRPEQKLKWIDNFRWTARSAQHFNIPYMRVDVWSYEVCSDFKKRSEGMNLQEDSTIGDCEGWLQKEAKCRVVLSRQT
jgi:hypothetical protein